MRIYIPVVPADLGAPKPPVVAAVAATADFQRENHVDQWTEEDYESLAMDAAAGVSAQFEPVARVVLAADAQVKEMGSGLVTYEEITWDDVVSIHVDGQFGRELLQNGDYERLAEESLEWYDISERPLLVDSFTD